jgi:hypothetical protein
MNADARIEVLAEFGSFFGCLGWFDLGSKKAGAERCVSGAPVGGERVRMRSERVVSGCGTRDCARGVAGFSGCFEGFSWLSQMR